MLLSTTVRNTLADAAVGQIGTGAGTAVLQLRTGAAPASTEDAAAGTLLAEFELPTPAFGAATAGVATAEPVPDTVGVAAGTVGHYRVVDRAGACAWQSNSVGTSEAALVLNTTSISVGVDVSLTSWTWTQPAGAN